MLEGIVLGAMGVWIACLSLVLGKVMRELAEARAALKMFGESLQLIAKTFESTHEAMRRQQRIMDNDLVWKEETN